MQALRRQWESCFEALCLPVPNGIFEALTERYSEGSRAYHTLQHVRECFQQFGHVHDAHSPGAVGVALWFHDSIYDPRASDNEIRSARWACDVLAECGATKEQIGTVSRLILATQHNTTPQVHDEQIIVDIDLSILGAAEQRYREYAAQIRREYDWVEESAFRRERKKVLQHFLEQPSVYSTENFRVRLEGLARHNLLREFQSLS